jgi:hypothetical protein
MTTSGRPWKHRPTSLEPNRPTSAQDVHALGNLDHFRDPMTTAVERINPFGAEHTQSRLSSTNAFGNSVESLLIICNEVLGLLGTACQLGKVT